MAILKETIINGNAVVNGSMYVNEALYANYNGASTDVFSICKPSVWKVIHKYGGDSYPSTDTMTGYYYTLLDGSIVGFLRKKFISAKGLITCTDKYSYPVTVKNTADVYVLVSMTTGFSPEDGTELSNRFFTQAHLIAESFTTTDFVVRLYKDKAESDVMLGYRIILFIPSTNILK